LDDEFLKQSYEFRFLFIGRRPPVAAEREAGHSRQVEGFVQEPAKAFRALILAQSLFAKRGKGLVAHILDKVLRIGRLRWCCVRQNNEDKRTQIFKQ
jgi:hypothetical protein